MLEPLMSLLAPGRPLLGFDTLGNGDSERPRLARPEIADYAAAVAEALERLDLDEVDVFGTHTGALIALELGLAAPRRIRNLILDGLPVFTPERRAEFEAVYAPSLEPRWDGTHVLTAWNFLRDHALWWPWYDRRRENMRRAAADGSAPLGFSVDANALQRGLVELLKAWDSYGLAYAAAFRHDPAARLPQLRVRTLIAAQGSDMMHRYVAPAGELLPTAETATLPDELDGFAAACAAFLDAGS
jgi:pimeloyl-ACP methyl ester carboxylesterase